MSFHDDNEKLAMLFFVIMGDNEDDDAHDKETKKNQRTYQHLGNSAESFEFELFSRSLPEDSNHYPRELKEKLVNIFLCSGCISFSHPQSRVNFLKRDNAG